MTIPQQTSPRSTTAVGHVMHTATEWLRALSDPPTRRHDNLARLSDYLGAALQAPGATYGLDDDTATDDARSPSDRLAADLPASFADLDARAKRPVRASGEDAPKPVSITVPTGYLLDQLRQRPDAADPARVRFSAGVLRYSEALHVHLGLSLWSPPAAVDGATAPSADDIAAARRFRVLGQLWQDAIENDFWVAPYTVERRPYHPPVFWAVPSSMLQGNQTSLSLCRELLNVASTEAPSVHTSQIWLGSPHQVSRRVNANEGGGIRPLYVLSAFDRDDDDEIRQLVELLGQTEATLAHPMWDLENGVQMDRALLATYDQAASRGAALWDRLAMLIPVAGRNQLAGIHRQVRLVHQTLLQGVSDVEDVAKHVADSASKQRVEQSQARRGFQEQLTEVSHPDAGRAGLYDDMVSSGYAADVDQALQQIVALADRVRTRYTQLFQAVTGAVEDRRAREFDVIQRFAFVIALTLTAAVVSFGTGVFGDSMNTTRERWTSLAIAGGLLVALLCWLTYVVTSGARLGSPRLTTHLKRAQQIMTAASTFELALRDGLLTRELEVAGYEGQDHRRLRVLRWDSWDARLARDLARAWDDSVATQYCRRRWPPLVPSSTGSLECRSTTDELRVLEDRVGRWMLQTLLTTERPRRTYSPALPRVCLLYRALESVRSEPEWVTASIGAAAADWIGSVRANMSDQEVEFMMAHAFPEMSLAKAERRVRDLLDAVPRLQRAGKPDPTACEVLTVIEAHVRQWRSMTAAG